MSDRVYNSRQVHRLVVFSISITCLALLVVTVFRSLIVPLCLASFFAYILYPAMMTSEVRFKFSRLSAVCLVMFLLTLALAGSIAGIIPIIRMELIAILEMLPQAKAYVLGHGLPWLIDVGQRFGIDLDAMINLDVRTFNFSDYVGSASETVQNLFNQTSNLLSTLAIVLLTPLFLFFFLLESGHIRTFVRSLVPLDLRQPMRDFAFKVDITLKSVLKRQLMVSLMLACLYCIGFSIIGLKFSLAVGIITGLCRMVPYLDVIVGILLSFVIIVTDPESFGWSLPIGVAVVIGVVQLVDGMVITPRVIGDKVGLHPAVVIASVIAFSDWLGFAGVLIAIPAAAILKILVEESLIAYRNSSFYKQKAEGQSDWI